MINLNFKNSVIVYANYYQFSPGQTILNPAVLSRMFLWCKTGKGEITINKKRFIVSVDDYYFLPWKHSISYKADPQDPFLAAGIHIIPDHLRSKKIEYQVAHTLDHPLANVSWRKDVIINGLTGVLCGTLQQQPYLRHLAEYVVGLFKQRNPEEWQARNLAQCLLAEISGSRQQADAGNTLFPLLLQQMLQYIENNPNKPLSLIDLVRFSGLSSATVGRMFKQYVKLTPVQWITKTKMNLAKQLLSSSRLNVGEVGVRVGTEDPYYFSKLFKKSCGMTPLGYRKKSLFL